MKLYSLIISFFAISIIVHSEAYRILGVLPINAYSHFIMFERLMKGLAERGHQVDVVSHFPQKESFPNYTDIVSFAGTTPTLINNMTLSIDEKKDSKPGAAFFFATAFGVQACKLMDHSEFLNLIRNPPQNPPYDLIITEIFGANCYLALGHLFQVPVVGFVTGVMLPWANSIVANPDNTAYIPNPFLDNPKIINFWHRLENTLSNVQSILTFNYYSAAQDDVMKKSIGPHVPSIREAEKNVSLILTNSHYSINGVRPFTAAVVEVGGLHIDERKIKLSELLRNWLDESRDGFVYVSFGSMGKIESLPKEIVIGLYASMAKFAPVRFLIKVAEPGELPAGIPSNVLTQRWISQLAVLKHKYIRAFVTHGGLLGTQEAVYYGVPMIGIPFFGDQEQNVNLYKQLNMAVGLKKNNLTEENLNAALRAVLYDPSYRKAAKNVSAQFRDRPMSALDTAIFWIEYVIRHGGTNLKSPAMDLTWWQIALLDVFGFLLFCAVLTLGLVVVVLNKLIKSFCHKGSAITVDIRDKKTS